MFWGRPQEQDLIKKQHIIQNMAQQGIRFIKRWWIGTKSWVKILKWDFRFVRTCRKTFTHLLLVTKVQVTGAVMPKPATISTCYGGIPQCFQPSRAATSLQCVLGLPRGLLPVGHDPNNSPGRNPSQMPEPLRLASFDVEVCQLYPVSPMTRQKLVIQTLSPDNLIWTSGFS